MRSEVMWFANRMSKKLDQRMASKDGWMNTSYKVLLGRMLDEVIELIEAMQGIYRDDISLPELRKAYTEVIKESGDVGNFAMMVADKARRTLE